MSERPGGTEITASDGGAGVSKERPQRVGEAIKEELSDILRNDLKDPRIGFASVVKVEVSQDLRHAKIYISVFGDDNQKRATMKGLESAAGFIRSEVSRRIRLRFAPELSFSLDESIEQGARIARLLGDLRRGAPGGETGE